MADQFGMTDQQMIERPIVYRHNLLQDKVVLVSGAGSGLGKAMAFLFAPLGAKVVTCGRNAEKLEAAQVAFSDVGLELATYKLTIRDAEAVDDMIDGIRHDHGPVDVLINNAGGQYTQNAVDLSVKGWQAVIDTNLNGTWYMTQAAAKRWIEHKRPGNVINIVADIWRRLPQMAHTAAARAGVIYMSKSVAVEWAPCRIRVNCIAPGCCESSAFERYLPEGSATFHQANPMLKAGDEWDIAEAAVYLAAPSAKFVTGEVLTVDGGQQCWGDPWPAGRPQWFEIESGLSP